MLLKLFSSINNDKISNLSNLQYNFSIYKIESDL